MRRKTDKPIVFEKPEIDRLLTGCAIRNCRKVNSLTVEQVAEAVGVTNGVVYCWETGRELPVLKNIVSLASLFNVKVDDILVIK